VNKNRLLIALVVLAVLGGALASALRSRQSDTVVAKPKTTLPEIKRDDISKVELENPEKSLILTLAKQDGKWTITAPFAAKADSAAVDALLDKLSGLEVVRVAATRKENHELVGVDVAHGIRVKAYVADKPVLDAYIGKANGSGTTLRKEGEDQVLAVRGSIRYAFDKELKSFRDRTITDSDPATITGITLTSAKGSFKFEKPGAAWQQVKGEKPIKDFAPSKVDSLVSSFAKLRATDFAEPSATAESTGLTAPTAKLVLTPKEGAPVTVELGALHADKNDYFARSSQSEVIFRVSKYTGDRLVVDGAAFSEPPKKPGEEPAAPPEGMDMPSAAGGQQIPPELLRQLQQQMGQQGSPH
jgi:hypothetical protein